MDQENKKKSIGQFFNEAASKIAQKSTKNFKQLQSDMILLGQNNPKLNNSQQNHSITYDNNILDNQNQQIASNNYNNRQQQINNSNANSQKQIHQIAGLIQNSSSQKIIQNEKDVMTQSRVKQIQQEKIKITQQLRKLDDQIALLKSSSHPESNLAQNDYQKRIKISKNQQAQSKAKTLVKNLNKQRKVLEQKRKRDQQKLLEKFQVQQEEKRKIRQIQVEKAKQQRRLAIEKRLQEQKKRREERKIIDAQSNNLISQLKKQQKFQKQKNMVPSQLFQVEHRKKLLQNKKKLDFAQIQQHQRRYRQLKIKQRSQKKVRDQSLKQAQQQMQYHHKLYPKNRWMELIEQQDKKRKYQQKNKQQVKRLQLQKRKKYGELVHKIFLPKKVQSHLNNHSYQQQQQPINNSQKKPQTPDELPKVNLKVKSQKRKTYDQKIYKQQSLPTIKDNYHIKKKKMHLPPTQQLQNDDKQKQAIKMKMKQLRAQTNQRLKKMQNKSIQALKRNDTRHKYQNYLGKVKIKRKQQDQEWKKVLDNKQMSSEQKYRQLMNKASVMQNKAKLKQNMKKDTDQDAINLYIGSIQAKLALLQKF